MQIPLSWIKEYISIQSTPEEIARILTLAGIEVDKWEAVEPSWQGIVVGQVLTAEKHPNADKLKLATVTDGKETYQVVCGAPNCRAGMKVAFAPIGASLKEPDGGEFKIKQAKIRGSDSFGMLCSGKELQLTDDSEGILDLSSDFQVGVSLAEIWSDTIFHISLTPNLNHCASVLGIARELSAATGLPVRTPLISVQESDAPIENFVKIRVEDEEGCPRYTSRLIKNVKIGPSPDWLKMRLERCGMRSVNNVVDVTNYVLLELGHPLHGFDVDKLEGHQIVVRRAKEGETIVTLDNRKRILSAKDLVICDAERPEALAGVMGGLNSEMGDHTRNILIESAYFDPITVRKTSKRLGVQTEGSKRFERGADPNGVLQAVDRVTMLIKEIAGGEVARGVIDIKFKEFPEKEIACRLSRIHQILGVNLSVGEVELTFQRLQFQYTWNDPAFLVRVPTYRVDIQSEIDLIEEVIRIYGYNNIDRKPSFYESSKLPHTPMFLFEKEVQQRLIGEGLQEFLTCDLIGPALTHIVQHDMMSPEAVVNVINPTSIEQSILRTSLLPGLLGVIKYNIDHQNQHIAGFEQGRIHFKEGDHYREQSIAAIILSGKSRPHHWAEKPLDYDFFDLKGIVESLLKSLGIPHFIFKNLEMPIFHTGRQASIFVDSLEVGSIGEIHPSICRRLDVNQRIFFGELNLHDLLQRIDRKEKLKEVALYPSSERDWTITIKEEVDFSHILHTIEKLTSPLLEEVSLLDIYRSEKLPKGYQNVTLHFVYRDRAKTVSQELVDAEHRRLTTHVLDKLKESVAI